MALSSRTTTVLAICASAVVLFALKQRKKGKNLPPGPKKRPIIDNLLDIPVQREWETFKRWGEEHGSDIIHASALGNSLVILNSYQAAEDLLDKRSSIYSSRPHLTLVHELSGFGFGFGLLPYGDTWRASRKLMAKHLNPSHPEINQPREIKYVRQFLVTLLDDPENFMDHIRHVVGANALSTIYGIEVQPKNDPYVAGAEKMAKAMGELLVPGGYMVDAFPFLKHLPTWFPGVTFHRVAASIRESLPLVRDAPFAATEEIMKTGAYEPSLALNGLVDIESSASKSKDVEFLKDVCAQVLLGAADTSVSTIGSLFLAMTIYPEVQRKAQKELDQVLDGRLPEHADIQKLPYLSAVVLEVLRWHPVTPIGIPHVVISDDTYRDYHIPAGSLIIPNAWAMLHDEDVYPDPFTFNPDRFLKNGQIDPQVRSPLEIAFGFGRRACPGRYLALSMISMTAASVLASFDLLKQLDHEGNPIEPKEEYQLAAVCQPLPFPCRIVPRSAEATTRTEAVRPE